MLGASSYAVTIILSTFMAGLGLGAWLIGKKADQFAAKKLIRAYIVLEVGIGVYSMLLPVLLEWSESIYVAFQQSYEPSLLVFNGFKLMLAALLLIVPTTLIGATLPVISRYIIRRQDHISIPVARLYAMNTLGGFLGTVLAGYYLLPALGIVQTTGIAISINFAVAAAFWLVNILMHPDSSAPAVQGDLSAAQPETCISSLQKAVLGGFFLSGMAAMFYEVAWTRTLSMILGTTTFAFTTMLATFLVGIALGSSLYGIIKHFLSGIKLVVALQFIVACSVLLSIPLFESLPLIFVILHDRFVQGWTEMQMVRFFLAGSVMLIPTVAMGLLFPAVSAVFIDNTGHLGRRLGQSYGLNTLGNVLGSVLCGLILIPAIGMQKAIIAGAVLNLVAGCMIQMSRKDISIPRRMPAMAAAGIILFLAFSMVKPWSPWIMNSGVYVYAPRYEKMLENYQRLAKRNDKLPEASAWEILKSSMHQYELLHYDTGPAATVAVMEDREGTRFLSVDGKTDASTGQKSDMETQVMIGQLPLLFHENPDKVLVVGLGSGVTVGSALTHDVRVVDCAEISTAVAGAAELFSQANHNALEDPRLRIVPRDARNMLLTSEERYDVIISQPSNPWISGQSNLFSLEFYQLVSKHLKPGGLFLQWTPSYLTSSRSLKIIVHTMRSVFPHLTAWTSGSAGDMIFMARKGEKLQIDYSEFVSRVSRKPVKQDIERVGLNPELLPFELFVMNEDELPVYIYADLQAPLPQNTDDRLITEFSAPRQLLTRNRISRFVQPDRLHGNLSSLLQILKNVQIEEVKSDILSENT
ncbi:putative membrane-bound spermidine synthase [Desulfosalsimonas propionicica]|uniref:Polyamine aminopropyltransferase n=1 Tax=Desulfosalsimonas propionicica TaxID=332175 RepID=A0A7W0C943_9BACT|nr:fused MFS/spermidine synthase [Desulfosalsimonas propionicica]MBA2881445.1 putative membrane-bound spermidine synthase [Desulfosalsimonas propionicica]